MILACCSGRLSHHTIHTGRFQSLADRYAFFSLFGQFWWVQVSARVLMMVVVWVDWLRRGWVGFWILLLAVNWWRDVAAVSVFIKVKLYVKWRLVLRSWRGILRCPSTAITSTARPPPRAAISTRMLPMTTTTATRGWTTWTIWASTWVIQQKLRIS